jgi:uncharacterized protein YdeI (YjbR/CyaY-like superfamily)
MASRTKETLDVRSRHAWRNWLAKHHDAEDEIWLVFHKTHTGVKSIAYDDAVEEAICFGWIDSLITSLDDERYARKFTPRTEHSRWSTINRRRFQDLKSRGMLAAPGLARAPTERSGDKPARRTATLPKYIREALEASPKTWEFFQRLAPSHRRNYVVWIDSAKRQETKERRLLEAIKLLAAGKQLGLK